MFFSVLPKCHILQALHKCTIEYTVAHTTLCLVLYVSIVYVGEPEIRIVHLHGSASSSRGGGNGAGHNSIPHLYHLELVVGLQGVPVRFHPVP